MLSRSPRSSVQPAVTGTAIEQQARPLRSLAGAVLYVVGPDSPPDRSATLARPIMARTC